MPRGRKETAPDPELSKRWTDWRIGLATLIGVAALALGDHLRGNEKKELGSYYRFLQQAIRQSQRMQVDPSSVFIELPENRTFTRLAAEAARSSGIPIHSQYDPPLPRYYRSREEIGTYGLIPHCVDAIRTWRFQGGSGFFYEEIDLLRGESTQAVPTLGDERIRTVSALVGKDNTMITSITSERGRALRILSLYEIGQQVMAENNLKYEPHLDTSK